jgi:tetratricopeptide (TPR) repeat protein
MHEFALALPDLEFAIQAQPDDLGHIFNRAQARFQTQDYAGTIADSNKILQRLPDNVGAYYLRSIANQRLGRLNAALSDMDTLIRLKPEQEQQFKQSRESILSQMKQLN